MKLVGLCGPAGSGKSTVAAYLAQHYGAARYAFGRPLKAICVRTLDLAPQQVDGTQAEKEAVDPRYGFSARKFIQRLGTEGFQTVLGKDFWINLCLWQVVEDAPDLAVIEDVRFVPEARAVTEGRVGSIDVEVTYDLATEIAWYTEGHHLGVDREWLADRLYVAMLEVLGERVVVPEARFLDTYVWRLEPMRVLHNSSTAETAAHASETGWHACPYDVRVAPRERGLEYLNAVVRRAAAFCCIQGISRDDERIRNNAA